MPNKSSTTDLITNWPECYWIFVSCNRTNSNS